MASETHGLVKRIFTGLAWVPILVSLALLLVVLPALLASGAVCVKTLVAWPLFLAYIALFAFPLVIFGITSAVQKRFSVSFESKNKEFFLAFWVWMVLMGWMVFSFLSSSTIPLVGFGTVLSCAP